MKPRRWKAIDRRHQKNGQILIMDGFRDVANVFARNPECERHAALIAAAPELADELEAERERLEWVGLNVELIRQTSFGVRINIVEGDCFYGDTFRDAIDKARAALKEPRP